MLTTPASRNQLATCWENIAASARIPARPLDPRVPVAAAQIKAAQDDVLRLVEALRAPQPVAARGIAVAAELLQDGRGPVYNPSSAVRLSDALRDARRHLGATMVQMAAG